MAKKTKLKQERIILVPTLKTTRSKVEIRRAVRLVKEEHEKLEKNRHFSNAEELKQALLVAVTERLATSEHISKEIPPSKQMN